VKTLLETDNGMCVVQATTAPEVEELIRLFEKIAEEQHWQPGDQLRAYPESSIHFGLMAGTSFIGGLQLVLGGNSKEGMPCLTVWPELDLRYQTDVADIALLALDEKHRGQNELFWPLCIEMWRYCERAGITRLMVEATREKQVLYRRFGWPLKAAGEVRLHWGEPCQPCWMTTAEINTEMATKSSRGSLKYATIFSLMHRIRDSDERP